MRLHAAFALVLGLLSAAGAQAQFAAQISPPRFEDKARPGTVFREVVEITNSAPVPTRLKISTADWTMEPDGTVQFQGPLAEDSCRPWTALEATEIDLPANGRKRFRFEVRVPADAPSKQCRFALMFEGEPVPVPGMALPVAGRIGVIVYLDVGDVAARLEVVGSRVEDVEGLPTPILQVRNSGNAHGRLLGFLDATDAAGERWTLAPSSNPILPGSTRDIPLTVMVRDDEPVELAFPLQLSGRLEWRDQRVDVDTRVSR
jgi:hypothetical protein